MEIMTHNEERYKLEVRKWRSRAKNEKARADILSSMIDHLEIRMNDTYPGRVRSGACYGDIIDEAVRMICELKELQDVQAEPEGTETESDSGQPSPDSQRGDTHDSVHRETDEDTS
jgi:hypothetical protein